MAKITIPALVEGGKATPAPPLGPSLAPTGVNIGQIIAAINEKTKSFAGMQVPVKVTVDKDTKQFEIEVGTPPVSALVKKELGITEPVKEEAGAKGKKPIGNLSFQQVIEIARKKEPGSLSKTLKALVKEVIGTCQSMGATVEGKEAKEAMKLVESGELKAE
ncbi:MAG: 50S ribosomal protein L11 [Candidatus Micrarchaeota archaeon]|nr:50S ribosomal protein L11 [Candidatus Micrarchaeota archaeon]